jgi:Leucine-rich repeat (LRR) protein
MGLGFGVAATKIGVPVAKFLLKKYLGEAFSAGGGGLFEMAAQKIADEESQRAATRIFEDIGDKVVRWLLPIFHDIEDNSAQAIAHEIGLTLEERVTAGFFISRDLDPAALTAAFQSARSLPPMFTEAEAALYSRGLNEAVRYIVSIAQSLPEFEVTAAAAALGRLSRIGADLDRAIAKVSRIERLVEKLDTTEEAKRFEADYRQAVQRNLDYLELFGADISQEAQRHSLSVGYVSLNLASGISGQTTEVFSADDLAPILSLRHKRLLLRGHAGSGKSTLLRWLAIEIATGSENVSRWSAVYAFLSKRLHDYKYKRHANIEQDVNLFDLPENVEFRLSMDESMRLGVIDSRRTVILPTAGLGSTAFLGTADFVKLRRRLNLSKSANEPQLIPFLIRLRDCSSGRLPTPDELPNIIASEIGRPPLNWVKSVLEQGNGLILLDGVDELPNHRRESIRRDLEALVKHYPKNHVVVTTRPSAVPDGWLTSIGFVEAALNPMSERDRSEFIRRWHAAVSDELARQGKPADLSGLAAELITKLAEAPPIARLGVNPLLCAALCALHRDRHRQLPESQSELCEALCHLLLHRRETESGPHLLEFPQEYQDLTYEQKRAIVQGVAHYMVRNDESVVPDVEARNITATTLRGFPNGRPEHADLVLKVLVERCGVLQEQRPKTIEFIHNTLKEFLAAEMFVADHDFQLLGRRSVDDEWRPVVLFAAATRNRDFATELVRRILDLVAKAKDPALGRRLKLAAVSCRYAALHMDSELVQRLSTIERELVPPRSMEDAEALAGSSDNVVPLLRHRRMKAREAAACVRTLRLVGTDSAKRVLEGYIDDKRQAVVAELSQAVNPLRLAAVRDLLLHGDELSTTLARQVTDLSPLSNLTTLEKLNLRGTAITDCSPLRTLKALEILDLSQTGISSIDGIADLKKITNLDISDTHVHDITPISNFELIRELDCKHTPITDLQPLANLAGLEIVNIAETKVEDLKALHGLNSIKDLDISDLPKFEWKTLGSLSTIERLRAYKTIGMDAKVVASLPNLRSADLGFSDLTDISAFANKSSIESFSIPFTVVSDIEAIGTMINLVNLTLLGSKNIKNFRPLRKLGRLRNLNISYTEFADLSILEGCIDLELLYVDNTSVTSLSGIEKFSTLKGLSIVGLEDIDLYPLVQLQELTTLRVRRFKTAHQAILSEMPKLAIVEVPHHPTYQ